MVRPKPDRETIQHYQGGNIYYQQRLDYITLGALFRHIRRGDKIQNSRYLSQVIH